MTISIDKQYRTRNGKEVRIYAVDGCGDYPIHGAVQNCQGWSCFSWPATGLHESCENIDLIEIKPRIKREFWMNVYPDDWTQVYESKNVADEYATGTRIACVKVVIDCEEGEGL